MRLRRRFGSLRKGRHVSAEAIERFNEFVHAARLGPIRAVVSGGASMRLKIASVLLVLAAGLPSVAHAEYPGEAVLVAAAGRPAASVRIEPADAARDMLLGMMRLRCKSQSLAQTIAQRNMECRNVRGAGLESSIDQLAEAEMLGEIDRMPVFLAPSERVYVNHMQSRGGSGREWVPMLVISRGMAEALLPLGDVERRSAVAFLLGRETELMRTSLDDFADFGGFQKAMFVSADLDRVQAGVEMALKLQAAPGAVYRAREAGLREQFATAREMKQSAMRSSARER